MGLGRSFVSLIILATPAGRATEMVFKDVRADSTPHRSARLLIKTEMDAAVNSCIVNVIGDLAEIRILEGHARKR